MPAAHNPRVTFPDGSSWPALGLGTWRYGETARRRSAEVAALRQALEIGYRVFDTAEMYGEGGAETVLGQALREAMAAGDVKREALFIVSKVYPHNAGGAALQRACDASRRRLGLECIDLYLLHWRGNVPLADTVAGFEALRQRGAITRWGVSNFDVADLQELFALPGGAACAANQVYFSLGERGPQLELLPWQRRQAMPLMAYSPLDEGALGGPAAHATLARVAQRHGATPAQVALAALISIDPTAEPGVMVIPKSSDVQRLLENWGAAALQLDAQDHAELDRAFPPPRRKPLLAMR